MRAEFLVAARRRIRLRRAIRPANQTAEMGWGKAHFLEVLDSGFHFLGLDHFGGTTFFFGGNSGSILDLAPGIPYLFPILTFMGNTSFVSMEFGRLGKKQGAEFQLCFHLRLDKWNRVPHPPLFLKVGGWSASLPTGWSFSHFVFAGDFLRMPGSQLFSTCWSSVQVTPCPLDPFQMVERGNKPCRALFGEHTNTDFGWIREVLLLKTLLKSALSTLALFLLGQWYFTSC